MGPRRLVIAGLGLEGLAAWQDRPSFFLDALARFDEVKMGDPAFFTVQFMKTMKTDRAAAKLLLEAMGGAPGVDLSRIGMPTLVLCGDEDRDTGSPEALAEALPDGRFASVPGTHMSSVTKPDLGEAIAQFLVE
jgi:pimeloyl-ACP methyl ester carboxylesterase